MKTKLLVLCVLALGLLAGPVSDAEAGDKDRRGTAGSQQLLIPLTARTVGLGTGLTSGLRGASGLEGLFANPAALTVNTGTNAMFSRMQYVADIGVNYIGVAQRIGVSQVALTVNSWDFGEIPVQTEDAPEMSDVTWDAQYFTINAAYARQFTDRIAAGVTFKIVSERIDDMTSNGIAFDAGMTYVVGESGLRFGVSLKNFGPERKYGGTGLVRFTDIPEQAPDAQAAAVSLEGANYELPSLLNFGIAYTRDVGAGSVVTVLGNFTSNSFSQDQFTGGLELGFRDLLFVRGGYQYVPDGDLTFYTGANFGAGLNLDVGGNQLSVDYAYRATDFFDAVQMFTVNVTL